MGYQFASSSRRDMTKLGVALVLSLCTVFVSVTLGDEEKISSEVVVSVPEVGVQLNRHIREATVARKKQPKKRLRKGKKSFSKKSGKGPRKNKNKNSRKKSIKDRLKPKKRKSNR